MENEAKSLENYTGNKKHPELEDDEIFITNADNETYSDIDYETKRKGFVAYNIHGESLDHQWPGSFPVFVKKAEYDQHIEKYNNI